MIDYMMQDITDNMPTPKRIVPGTLVRVWSPSDYPFNKAQALAVLDHAAKTGFYITREMAQSICACLVSDGNVYPGIQCVYGSAFDGWGWLDPDGWHGGYGKQKEAYDACYASRVGWAG